MKDWVGWSVGWSHKKDIPSWQELKDQAGWLIGCHRRRDIPSWIELKDQAGWSVDWSCTRAPPSWLELKNQGDWSVDCSCKRVSFKPVRAERSGRLVSWLCLQTSSSKRLGRKDQAGWSADCRSTWVIPNWLKRKDQVGWSVDWSRTWVLPNWLVLKRSGRLVSWFQPQERFSKLDNAERSGRLVSDWHSNRDSPGWLELKNQGDWLVGCCCIWALSNWFVLKDRADWSADWCSTWVPSKLVSAERSGRLVSWLSLHQRIFKLVKVSRPVRSLMWKPSQYMLVIAVASSVLICPSSFES